MAASSTTVDLSRLPAPTLIEQPGFEAVLAAMVADLKARLPILTALIDSDPVMKLLQVTAYREVLLRRAFQDAGLQLFVAYATGANLDHLGALVGVARLTLTPADPVTGAPAIMESDDALRQRIVLAPESFTVAGPELAYVARAKAADAGVLDASATSPAPGEVLVSVLARTGDGSASAVLVDAVRAAVTDRAVRPLGDLVTVASADIVPFAVSASLITFAGPDPS
ncbi:MAG TPA: baseplate J/gp47 family protein, partial [Sphingomonas sp.]